jgi:biopolymer transport protein ExbD
MQLRRKNKTTSEVSTSSLNDIMFFLLLFFLIASTMANPNVVKLLLPKAKGTHVVNKNKKPINISVDANHKYYIDKEEIPQDQMEGRLKAAIQGTTDPSAIVHIDRNLKVQDLVDLLEIGTRLNMKMVLAADKNK